MQSASWKLDRDRWSKFCHGWTRVAFAMSLENMRREFDRLPWIVRKLFTFIQWIESKRDSGPVAVARLAFERMRAKRCGAVAGVDQGFLNVFGPPIKCDRWQGHHGNHRASYGASGMVKSGGAIEWPK